MSDTQDELEQAEATAPEVEDEEVLEDSALPFTYEITSYGADYTVDSLVRRMNDGDIVVPAFQREMIWNKKQRDRFIESLLLGLPVPGIFLSRDPESRLLVLDGQQRLRTLQAFYGGSFENQPFVLEAVQPRFSGRTYETLEEEDKRRLNDSIIHATVVRQDEPSDDLSSIYFIFERINTGGTALAPQEIRSALYQGEFNDLLGELNAHEAWRGIYGRPSKRLKDQELILRFFALRFERDEYSRPMEEFLNKFMASNRHLTKYDAATLQAAFVGPTELVATQIGRRAFRLGQPLNAAVYDSVMVGLSERLAAGPIDSSSPVGRVYEELLQMDEYVDACVRATADDKRVAARLELAIKAFGSLK